MRERERAEAGADPSDRAAVPSRSPQSKASNLPPRPPRAPPSGHRSPWPRRPSRRLQRSAQPPDAAARLACPDKRTASGWTTSSAQRACHWAQRAAGHSARQSRAPGAPRISGQAVPQLRAHRGTAALSFVTALLASSASALRIFRFANRFCLGRWFRAVPVSAKHKTPRKGPKNISPFEEKKRAFKQACMADEVRAASQPRLAAPPDRLQQLGTGLEAPGVHASAARLLARPLGREAAACLVKIREGCKRFDKKRRGWVSSSPCIAAFAHSGAQHPVRSPFCPRRWGTGVGPEFRARPRHGGRAA
jgi:hypothetical protein